MRTWIALFRGINVGGNNILPMANLRSDLASLQFMNVRTYIQSGNAVFDSTAKTASSLARKISVRIETEHGFKPQVLILDREDLLVAIQSNPFPRAVREPKTLHFMFLAEPATDPDLTALDQTKALTENYKLTDRVFYLHAPDGVGRSRLAAKAEKYLGVVVTGRNYRTVEKLLSMATKTES